MTKPPAAHTEASILKRMEKLGLGTPATRAAIIEKLKTRNYIQKKGKTLEPTPKGIELLKHIADKPFASPEMTAEWEKKLTAIRNRQNTYKNFISEISRFTTEQVNLIKAIKINTPSKTPIGKCPLCGGDILEGKEAYYCSYWKEKGCKFVIWKEIAGKKISPSIVKELLTKGVTKKLKGFTSKAGKKFEAKLRLRDGKVEFVFESKNREKKAG